MRIISLKSLNLRPTVNSLEISGEKSNKSWIVTTCSDRVWGSHLFCYCQGFKHFDLLLYFHFRDVFTTVENKTSCRWFYLNVMLLSKSCFFCGIELHLLMIINQLKLNYRHHWALRNQPIRKHVTTTPCFPRCFWYIAHRVGTTQRDKKKNKKNIGVCFLNMKKSEFIYSSPVCQSSDHIFFLPVCFLFVIFTLFWPSWCDFFSALQKQGQWFGLAWTRFSVVMAASLYFCCIVGYHSVF